MAISARSVRGGGRKALPYLGVTLQAGFVLLLGQAAMLAPLYFLSPLPAGLCLLLFLFLMLGLHAGFRKSERALERREFFRLKSPRPFLGFLLAAIPAIVVANLVSVLFYLSWFPDSREESLAFLTEYMERPGSWFPLFVLICLYAPLLEEFVFRGRLQGFLERRIPPFFAIMLPALIFAALHDAAVPRILMGVIFGVAVYLTRSLWSSVLLHASNNFIAFLGSYASESVGASPDMSAPTSQAWLQSAEGRLILFFGVILCLFWLFRLARNLYWRVRPSALEMVQAS